MASVLVHAVVIVLALFAFDRDEAPRTDLVDIELAPPPPPAEALPAEVVRKLDEQLAAAREEAAATTPVPTPDEEGVATDAGVPDAPPDARPDAAPTPDASTAIALADAAPDAPDADPVALADGGGDPADDAGGDATQVAVSDAGPTDALAVASIEDASPVPMSTEDAGTGSGSAAMTNEPAVDGAPTTAGTAANLLTYFPAGHKVTALIRFDRLRGTEWAAQTERLLKPMPDYQVLFGRSLAKVTDKLDTLVISTPAPRDATATTLVAHTSLGRSALRDFLAATTAVTWSTVKGGMLGTRTGKTFPNDKRVFLSPFQGWFLLAQPKDLGGLTAPTTGNLDTIEVKGGGNVPGWLGTIRTIEAESGAPRGPALVVTLDTGGKPIELGDNDFGLGVDKVPMPDRVSLAMELVKQGWLVRGNMRFATEQQASDFIAAAESVKERAGTYVFRRALGEPLVRVIENLSFNRTGGRVSYATSISIADARAILAAVAQQLDGYFGGARP